MKHTFGVDNLVFILIIPVQDQTHLLLQKEVFHLMKKMKIFSLPWTHQSGRFVLIYKKKEKKKSIKANFIWKKVPDLGEIVWTVISARVNLEVRIILWSESSFKYCYLMEEIFMKSSNPKKFLISVKI